ncbi:high affinity cGMP-specific 3',5'-cyclic phosphodiesterase 9A-like isoform X2 [Apostichopus japonicus]|uniref:high affinity cGMP-specific 3',5'-cyclic phosphodiesterase 9A-like isoform X2 n=1 Tax=Stichopus japonicus TaxID=307972 RepID=UPI003AB17054
MASKVIYFKIGDRLEQAEFRSDFPSEDVKDIFRAAAEAGPLDILKLYNTRGNIVNISPKLEENSSETRYRLEVVATYCDAEELGFDIKTVESRVENLEKKVKVDSGETPEVVYELRQKVENVRNKLEGVEHLSWLGLFKEFSAGSQNHLPFFKRKFKKTDHEQKRVWETFKQVSHLQLTDDVREYLRQPVFDNWQWEDAEMMLLLQQMFIDLDFITKFNIEMPVLQNFLFEVYKHYNNVPFHNFKHCFCVTQMMYGITWIANLCDLIGDLEVLVMIVSAICHDLDHPGYNNAYQVNARTELALRYNDISPLENHHCSIAFQILGKQHCNLFNNLSAEDFKFVRESMITCILATDMSKHNVILNSFKLKVPEFDYKNKEHVSEFMMICIKVADISNEARPMDVSEPWIDCLLQEFFNQSDVEKLEGLPVAPFMDREKVTKSSSQVGFIRFVLLPLFEALGALIPALEEHIIEPVRKGLEYYTSMGKALEEEKRKRENEAKKALENGGPDSNKSKQNGPGSRPPLETDPINNNDGPTKGVPNSASLKEKRTGKTVSAVGSNKNKSGDGVKPGVKAK